MLQSSAFAWLIGIAFMGQNQVVLPEMSVVWAMLLILILSIQFYWQQQLQQPLLRLINCILAMLISLVLSFSYAQSALQERLNLRETQTAHAEVIVYVNRINEPSARSIAQQVIVLGFKNEPVNWLTYTAINEKTGQAKTEVLQLGHYYRLTGEIRPAHAYATRGAFDQEKWYLQQNLMASFRIQQVQQLNAAELQKLGLQHSVGFSQKLHLSIEKKRLQVRTFILEQPLQHKGLLLGLLTGDRSLLTADLEEDFRRFGISHLLAISGPHVLIFAAMLCWGLQYLIRRYVPHIYLKIPKHYLLIVPFLSCVALYCACVGFEIPALRTLLICSLSCLFLLLKQAFKPLKLLIYSAALLLLLDPFSVLSAAFWLSYGACFILLRIYQTIQTTDQTALSNIQRVQQGLGLLIESQWKIFVALLPLMLIFFKQVAWISPITNLIAIPYLGLLVVPLDILAALGWLVFEPLGLFLWQINDRLLSIFLGLLDLLDTWFDPQLIPWAMNLWQIVALILALIILFLPRGIIPKTWSILCFIPIFFYAQHRQQFELHILDVGQGQAIFIRDQERTMMIDVGGSPDESRFSLGENVILPFLMRHGVQKLDQVVLTHLDQDHSGAYAALNEKMTIDQIMSNEKPESKNSFHYCSRGQKWHWPRVDFEVLSPPETALAVAGQAKNETSCVLYITYRGQTKNTHFLLMADAGWRTEHQILLHYPELKVDVLVLGHHGSKHSSAYGFLQHYRPQVAVVSAGLNNRYGHPTQEVAARLGALHIPWLTTIEQGSISFSFNEQDQLLLQAQRHAQLWLQREELQYGQGPQPLAHYINRPKQDWP
jgi:competence protein ComEC